MIDPPPKLLVTNCSDSSTVEYDEEDEPADQEPMYAVVKRPPSPQAATMATDVVESAASSEQPPSEAIGYRIERIDNDSENEPAEVSIPPRTEEMDILVENNSDSGSFDDAVYEIVD